MSDYRGQLTIVERLNEAPLPSLNRIVQDRKDAADEIKKLRSQLVKAQRIKSAARYYYDHFVQDEADDMECCISEDQHRAAKELRDALTDEEGKSDAKT